MNGQHILCIFWTTWKKYHVRDFLREKVRNNGSCLHMITYGHSNLLITSSSYINQNPKYYDHSMCIDASFMLVKICTKCVDHLFNFFEHIFTATDDTSTHIRWLWNFRTLFYVRRWYNPTIGLIIWMHESFFFTSHKMSFSPKIVYIYI